MFAKTGPAAAATTFLLLCTTSAFAVDATAFADRLKAVAAKQNAEIAYESAQAEGENVVLKGITLKQGPRTQELGDLTFENVTGSTADGWTVETVAVPDFEQQTGPNTTAFSGMVLDGLQLVGTDVSDRPAVKQLSDIFFDKATLGSVKVSRDGKPVYGVDDVSIENTVDGGKTLTSKFGVGGFEADLAAGGEAQMASTLRDIGYAKIAGSMNGTALWNPDSGLLKLDPFDITVDDAGSFSFTYAISGYTPEFVKSLQQVQAQMAANPENQQQAAMAMMGLFSQLEVNSADITFVDDTLTGKLLDYYAKRQNVSRDQLVENLTGMLPVALSYLQNPEFQQSVTSAVTTFLNDPQSLSIIVDPEKPIPATQLIGAAMSAPQTLPGVLSLTVDANDADMPASSGAADGSTPAPSSEDGQDATGGGQSSGTAN